MGLLLLSFFLSFFVHFFNQMVCGLLKTSSNVYLYIDYRKRLYKFIDFINYLFNNYDEKLEKLTEFFCFLVAFFAVCFEYGSVAWRGYFFFLVNCSLDVYRIGFSTDSYRDWFSRFFFFSFYYWVPFLLVVCCLLGLKFL